MLDLHLGLMVTVAVIFFALIVLLKGMLYTPLLSFMEERKEGIEEDLANAKSNSSGSEEITKEAELILDEARSEASEIRSKAIEEAKAKAQKRVDAKAKELEEEFDVFAKELEAERATLESALVAELPAIKEALKVKIKQAV